jgi:hypothetical protein
MRVLDHIWIATFLCFVFTFTLVHAYTTHNFTPGLHTYTRTTSFKKPWRGYRGVALQVSDTFNELRAHDSRTESPKKCLAGFFRDIAENECKKCSRATTNHVECARLKRTTAVLPKYESESNEIRKQQATELVVGQVVEQVINSVTESLRGQYRSGGEQSKLYQEIVNHEIVNQEMVNQGTVNQEMVNQETVNQEMVNQKTVNQEMVNQETVNQEMVNQETVNQEMVNQETVNQEMVNRETVNQEMVNQETVSQEMVNQETVNQEMVNQGTVSQEMAYQNFQFSKGGWERMVRLPVNTEKIPAKIQHRVNWVKQTRLLFKNRDIKPYGITIFPNARIVVNSTTIHNRYNTNDKSNQESQIKAGNSKINSGTFSNNNPTNDKSNQESQIKAGTSKINSGTFSNNNPTNDESNQESQIKAGTIKINSGTVSNSNPTNDKPNQESQIKAGTIKINSGTVSNRYTPHNENVKGGKPYDSTPVQQILVEQIDIMDGSVKDDKPYDSTPVQQILVEQIDIIDGSEIVIRRFTTNNTSVKAYHNTSTSHSNTNQEPAHGTNQRQKLWFQDRNMWLREGTRLSRRLLQDDKAQQLPMGVRITCTATGSVQLTGLNIHASDTIKSVKAMAADGTTWEWVDMLGVVNPPHEILIPLASVSVVHVLYTQTSSNETKALRVLVPCMSRTDNGVCHNSTGTPSIGIWHGVNNGVSLGRDGLGHVLEVVPDAGMRITRIVSVETTSVRVMQLLSVAKTREEIIGVCGLPGHNSQCVVREHQSFPASRSWEGWQRKQRGDSPIKVPSGNVRSTIWVADLKRMGVCEVQLGSWLLATIPMQGSAKMATLFTQTADRLCRSPQAMVLTRPGFAWPTLVSGRNPNTWTITFIELQNINVWGQEP